MFLGRDSGWRAPWAGEVRTSPFSLVAIGCQAMTFGRSSASWRARRRAASGRSSSNAISWIWNCSVRCYQALMLAAGFLNSAAEFLRMCSGKRCCGELKKPPPPKSNWEAVRPREGSGRWERDRRARKHENPS